MRDTESAWIEIPGSPDAEESEHPAPSLTLTAAEADAHGAQAEGVATAGEGAEGHGDGGAEGPASADAADAQVTARTSDTLDEPISAISTGTNRLTVLALVAGLLGLVLGATALVTARRR